MHTDRAVHPDSDAIVGSALSRGVPVITARQLLLWTDARNRSSIANIQFNNGTQTFTVDARPLARGLELMLPLPAGYGINSATRDGNAIPYVVREVKGLMYAVFPALTGDYAIGLSQDTTPPTVTAVQPGANEVEVTLSTSPSVTFSEPMDIASIHSATVLLRDPANSVVPAVVSYNATTRTATLDPNGMLAANATYTVTVEGGVGGVADLAGNVMAADYTSSFSTVAAAQTVSIWNDLVVPSLLDGGADSPVSLGVKFSSEVAGNITGIRFYKSAANTGTHVGSLWTSGGTLLDSVTFTSETPSGWQQVDFASPIPIAANTMYVASYHCTGGHYSVDLNYFTNSGADNAPLHALQSGVFGPNGVYGYGPSSTFPTASWQNANYWVDIVFQPGAP
jgi:hypothetical protein